MALFSNKKNKKSEKKSAEVKAEISHESKKSNIEFKAVSGQSVIRSFHVSEKASRLISMNQYVLKVASTANKSEIAKQVERLFNVEVKAVRILNMPEKEKNLGRHVGIKPGYKKALVTLVEGFSIEQAKP